MMLFLLAQTLQVSGLEMSKNPQDYRSFRIEFYDALSGVRMFLDYGSDDLKAGKGGKLSIMAKEERANNTLVVLNPDEINAVHLDICNLVEHFSLKDDENRKAFEDRSDRCIAYGFELTIYSQEQGVTLRYSHLDERTFNEAKSCFLSLVNKFPEEWKSKISWADKKADSSKASSD